MSRQVAQFNVTFEHDYLNKQEFDRDVQFQASGDGSSYPIPEAYPLSRIRWHHYLKPTEVEASDPKDTSSKTIKRSLSATSAATCSPVSPIVLKRKCESQVPLEHKRRRTDRSWSDASSGHTDDSTAPDIQNISESRFDPRFLKIGTQQGSELQDRIAKAIPVVSYSRNLARCSEALNERSNRASDQRFYSAFVDFLNEVGETLYGKDRYCPAVSLPYDRKSLDHDEHVERAGRQSRRKEKEHGRSSGILILRARESMTQEQDPKRNEKGSQKDERDVKLIVGIYHNKAADMSSEGGPSGRSNTVARVLKHMTDAFRSNGGCLIGRVFALTVCGTAIRLWTAHADSFASSRVFDLTDLGHRAELVKILAFVLSPVSEQEQRWAPSPCFRVHCSSTRTIKEIHAGPAEVLNIRRDLFGSRTAVWALKRLAADDTMENVLPLDTGGEATFDGSPSDMRPVPALYGVSDRDIKAELIPNAFETPMDIIKRSTHAFEGVQYVIKATWLTQDLVRYEERMLHLLHTGAAAPLQPLASDYVSAQVRSRIPKLVGMIEDEKLNEWTTLEVVSQNGAKPNRPPLHLSILVTTCRVGRRLPMVVLKTDKFSFRNYGEVFLGIVECLWFSASKGIHYRDLNLGNVMWCRLPDGKTVVAWLVDWGNARYLQAPRAASSRERTLDEAIQLAEDDGRSANPYFQSLPCAGASTIRDEYLQKASDLRAAREQAEAQGFDPETDEDCMWIKEEMDKKIEEARQTSHRYIDDLQSLIYLICYVMSLKLGKRPIYDLEKLADKTEKKKVWEAGCVPLARYLRKHSLAWHDFIVSATKLVRGARTALDHLSDIPDGMHQIENDCFHELHVLTKATLDDMSDAVLE